MIFYELNTHRKEYRISPLLVLKLNIILEQCKNVGEQCTSIDLGIPWLPIDLEGNCCKDSVCSLEKSPKPPVPKGQTSDIHSLPTRIGKCKKKDTGK
jgi:hypothetical protein